MQLIMVPQINVTTLAILYRYFFIISDNICININSIYSQQSIQIIVIILMKASEYKHLISQYHEAHLLRIRLGNINENIFQMLPIHTKIKLRYKYMIWRDTLIL